MTLAQAGTTNLVTRNANLVVDVNRRKNLLFAATNRKKAEKENIQACSSATLRKNHLLFGPEKKHKGT